METPHSNQPTTPGIDRLKSISIEEYWDDFLRQLLKAKPNGLVSESENGVKIYSFESWLRDTGKQANIQEYCNYIKDSNYMATAAESANGVKIPASQNVRVLATILTGAMLVGVCLYLLIAAFLATFSISCWNWLAAILFAASGPLLIGATLLLQYLRLKRDLKNGTLMQPQYIVKNFDNDEITFLRTKNKLFVEQKGQ